MESSGDELTPLSRLLDGDQHRKSLLNQVESLLKASAPASQLCGEGSLQTRLTDGVGSQTQKPHCTQQTEARRTSLVMN